MHISAYTIRVASVKLILMTVNLKHGFGLSGEGHIVYPDGKAEGICEEDGSVHWVDRTVPDVE